MTKINFRITNEGYSADFPRRDGLGMERHYYRRSDIASLAKHYGWESPDNEVPGHGWTVAELLIQMSVAALPYRVVRGILRR